MEIEFLKQYIEVTGLPFDIGDLQIRYYGIIIVVAMLLATVIAARLAQRSGKDPEHVYGALTWAIIPGIIFARLWFVLFPPIDVVEAGRDTAWFFQNFFDTTDGAIAIWSGGLSIFGAILGGMLGAYIYLRRNKLSVPQWFDIAAIVVPLGQSIGRWANFVNDELYGKPTDLPWGISIDRDLLPEIYQGIEYYNSKFHPIFLYESLWSFGAFLVLMWLFTNRRNAMKIGDFFLLFVMQYAVVRFGLEFLRVQVTELQGTDINMSQLVTGIAFILALFLYFMRRSSGMTYDEVAEYEREQAKSRAVEGHSKSSTPENGDQTPVESAT